MMRESVGIAKLVLRAGIAWVLIDPAGRAETDGTINFVWCVWMVAVCRDGFYDYSVHFLGSGGCVWICY